MGIPFDDDKLYSILLLFRIEGALTVCLFASQELLSILESERWAPRTQTISPRHGSVAMLLGGLEQRC